MCGVSRNVMAGFPAIFYCGYDIDDYQRALKQLNELIAHFRSQDEVSCAVAEAEDRLLIKLADLKIDLKPHHTQDIANINLFYQRHIRS